MNRTTVCVGTYASFLPRVTWWIKKDEHCRWFPLVWVSVLRVSFSALTVLVEWQEGRLDYLKNLFQLSLKFSFFEAPAKPRVEMLEKRSKVVLVVAGVFVSVCAAAVYSGASSCRSLLSDGDIDRRLSYSTKKRGICCVVVLLPTVVREPT